MAINPTPTFPTTLDTVEEPASTDDLDTLNREHDLLHQKHGNIEEVIEAKVGVNGSAVTTSIDYLIKNTTGGHNHDGTGSRKCRVETLVDAAGDILYASAADTLARLAIGTNGFFMKVASGLPSWAALEFSKGGTVLSPSGAINIIVWRATVACTVTAVKGYRVGGTGATINARKAGTSNHLASALSLTSADTWMDGGAVQNTAYAVGDKMEIMVVSVTGSPTQIGIQIDLTRP